MKEPVKAREQFRFYTRLSLSELTGLRASNLKELVMIMKEAPDSCVYHHTHRFLQQHQHLSPEPPNDFAYWVANMLGERELGERLASIDTVRFISISSLRDELVSAIDRYLKKNRSAGSKFTCREESFYFMKSISFILPTNYIVHDLKEFTEALKKVSVDSIYFHIFEARLRLERRTNDFSNWISNSLGDKALAGEIVRLDPYTHTLEELRTVMIRLIERKIGD